MESFIITAAPILFFVIGSFIVLSINFYSTKRNREKMEGLAKELGLEFQSSQGEKEVIAQVGQSNPRSQGIIQLLFRMFSKWRIVGNYGSDSVEIYTESRGSGKSKTVYTILFMGVKQPLPYKMEITKQGAIGGLFIKIFKLEDIQVGDEKFDKSFVIKGDNPEAIRKLCLDPSVQQPIYELMQEEGVRIASNGIYLEKRGLITDAPYFKTNLPKISSVCKKIYEGTIF